MNRPRPTAPDALQKILDNIKRETSPEPKPAPKPKVVANRRPAAAPDAHWFEVEKQCAHCHEVKNVGRDFGVTPRRGVYYANGWCKECRSATNYHALPRKNRTKNNP